MPSPFVKCLWKFINSINQYFTDKKFTIPVLNIKKGVIIWKEKVDCRRRNPTSQK